MGHRWVPFDDFDKVISESRVPACELICECGEDIPEHLSVQITAGTEEACAKDSAIAGQFRDRLGDGRFPGSCQPIEPEYGLTLRILSPAHDIFED